MDAEEAFKERADMIRVKARAAIGKSGLQQEIQKNIMRNAVEGHVERPPEVKIMVKGDDGLPIELKEHERQQAKKKKVTFDSGTKPSEGLLG